MKRYNSGDSCQSLLAALSPWCPGSAGISKSSPGEGCLPQHLLNLGLGLCDSFLNLLCSPPPGVCSHGIFIFCYLRLINKAPESHKSHTPRAPCSHLPQVSSGLLFDQILYSPFPDVFPSPTPSTPTRAHVPRWHGHIEVWLKAGLGEGEVSKALPIPIHLLGRALT